MFDIGWPELLVVAIVLVVVVGPKDLPRMLRTFGKTTNKLRSMAGDFRRQFDDALKEAELDDVKSMVSEAGKLDPTAEIKKHLNPMQKAGEEIRAGLDAALKPTPKAEETPKTNTPEEKSAVGAKESTKAVQAKPKPAAKPKKAAAAKTSTRKKTTPARKPASRKTTAKRSTKSTGAAS